MAERRVSSPISIDKMQPRGPRHPFADQRILDGVTERMAPTQTMVKLADYFKRSDGKQRKDLNPHDEEFIVKEDGEIHVTSLADLQNQLTWLGAPVQILGVASVGNDFQRLSAVVQGVNPDKPQSGFERPTIAEGPHMILAPYAVDDEGKMHVFRTIQYRTGAAMIDTFRGFADTTARSTGQQMYDIDGAAPKVAENMEKIIKEEGGEKFLDINRIVYLGAPRLNSSFVTTKSALFGVEVDYNNFVRSSKVVTQEEMARRQEAEDHEGLTGAVLDMTVDQYVNYKRDSGIDRDLIADAPADIVVLDLLAQKLDSAQAVMTTRKAAHNRMGNILLELKKRDPETYNEIARGVIQKEKKSAPKKP